MFLIAPWAINEWYFFNTYMTVALATNKLLPLALF